MVSLSEAVTPILRRVLDEPPRLGNMRLICIDGPSGAGKTRLAARIASRNPCQIVHMDDLYDGWDGLEKGCAQLDRIFEPMSSDYYNARGGLYWHYDWHQGRYTRHVGVPHLPLQDDPLLIVEGVGAGVAKWAHVQNVLVWVEAPEELRHRRVLQRDGASYREVLEQWWRDEQAHFTRERTRERADVIVDGT
jgi:uridine kinase